MVQDISQAISSDMTNAVKNVTVPSMTTDAAAGAGETRWLNPDWAKYWGYFNEIPDLHSAFLMKSIWNVGKGYTCDPETAVILDHVTGWGKDCFRDILFNMDLVKNIGGDSFSEKITDEETGELLNLKPLSPDKVTIIADKKGILKRYEYLQGDGQVIDFLPDEIFHLSNLRLADQIHGISRIKAMQKVIDAMNETFTDIKKVMHYQGRPYILWRLKTDDPTTIAAIKTKIDTARNLGEDNFIPDDDDAIRWEKVEVNPSAFILEWQNALNNKFYRAVGMPLVLFGQAGTTESGGKIEYLGHEQVFENDQKYLEEQVWQQLGLKINLIPPTSLLDSLQQDQSKDAYQGMEMQQSDMTAATGR